MTITSLEDTEWNEAVAASLHQTAFHNSGLARAFTEELGGNVAFFQVEGESHSWLTPVFYGEPWSRDGYFATSSVGYGGPLPLPLSDGNNEVSLEGAVSCLLALESHLGLTFQRGTLFPWRGWTARPEIAFSETMIVDMAATPDETFHSILQGNVRTAIRKAWKSGLDVKIVEDNDELDYACRLIEETQRAVGARYTTPASLIKKIHFESDVPGELIIVTWNSRPISAGVLLRNKCHSFHWLHGWERASGALCGNQLLIWTMMTRCLNQGCERLNLGFCHTPEQRLAKEKWGGVLVPVPTLLTFERK